ncbi:hypothetical protein [Rhizobium sp. RU36D]|uniref:hypothetical protein n=1 Tax=Rhizobium sp. RU36D TaxID=1907415 RepID=UPI0009D891E3|nr:hypothetical protein [Rhizobium sp. RU36D]SMD18595.1 hypothetical protein SAMN05880593_13543 [Rhizobium sp. RU36D]
MFVVAVIIGLLFVFNGFVTSAAAENVMQQIYGAIYIVGGTLCALIGGLMFTIGGVRKDLKDAASRQTPKSSP